MNCQEAVEWMHRYVDYDLGDEETSLLYEHIRQCSKCALQFEAIVELSARLSKLPNVTPKYSLVDRILPQLEEIDRARQEGGSTSETTESISIGANGSLGDGVDRSILEPIGIDSISIQANEAGSKEKLDDPIHIRHDNTSADYEYGDLLDDLLAADEKRSDDSTDARSLIDDLDLSSIGRDIANRPRVRADDDIVKIVAASASAKVSRSTVTSPTATAGMVPQSMEKDQETESSHRDLDTRPRPSRAFRNGAIGTLIAAVVLGIFIAQYEPKTIPNAEIAPAQQEEDGEEVLSSGLMDQAVTEFGSVEDSSGEEQADHWSETMDTAVTHEATSPSVPTMEEGKPKNDNNDPLLEATTKPSQEQESTKNEALPESNPPQTSPAQNGQQSEKADQNPNAQGLGQGQDSKSGTSAGNAGSSDAVKDQAGNLANREGGSNQAAEAQQVPSSIEKDAQRNSLVPEKENSSNVAGPSGGTSSESGSDLASIQKAPSADETSLREFNNTTSDAWDSPNGSHRAVLSGQYLTIYRVNQDDVTVVAETTLSGTFVQGKWAANGSKFTYEIQVNGKIEEREISINK